MFTYIKNIKNPAFKCFLQIIPFFLVFFIWRDWGTEIWNGIMYFFNNSSAIMNPLFKMAGDYILGALVFFSVWSIFIFSNIVNSKTVKDHIITLNFWKNISHITTLILFIYTVSYIMYNGAVYESHLAYSATVLDKAYYALGWSYLICLFVFVANIYLFAKSYDVKKESQKESKNESYY